VRRIATSVTHLQINSLPHDISCTDGLCDNCDGGGSSSGEEEENEHDLESVASFAQAHTNKTMKSLSLQHSNGTHNTFSFEMMLFPKCETIIFCFHLFWTHYWFSHNCPFLAFIICPPHTFQEQTIEVSLHSICCAANFWTKKNSCHAIWSDLCVNKTAFSTKQQFTKSVTYYAILSSNLFAVQHHILCPVLEQFFLEEEHVPEILLVFEQASYSIVSDLPEPEKKNLIHIIGTVKSNQQSAENYCSITILKYH
jgi:hypothetical protein